MKVLLSVCFALSCFATASLGAEECLKIPALDKVSDDDVLALAETRGIGYCSANQYLSYADRWILMINGQKVTTAFGIYTAEAAARLRQFVTNGFCN